MRDAERYVGMIATANPDDHPMVAFIADEFGMPDERVIRDIREAKKVWTMSQGLFPWSSGVPYGWSRWFAWYPVRTARGRLAWLRWVEVRSIGYVAPNGDLDSCEEYR